MYVHFGNGKCPLCGDFGQGWEKKTEMLSCRKCRLEFDSFFVFLTEETAEQQKFWN